VLADGSSLPTSMVWWSTPGHRRRQLGGPGTSLGPRKLTVKTAWRMGMSTPTSLQAYLRLAVRFFCAQALPRARRSH
jgi:hypothetical protein